MLSALNVRKQYHALSIVPTQNQNAAPVLYELDSDSTEIGSAEDNAIVLSDPSIQPHHLAIRHMDEQDFLLVDLAGHWHDATQTWVEYRPSDAYWCPRHGNLSRLDERTWCPHCKNRRGSLWLMRPLKPGDSFELGNAFRATYVIQDIPSTSETPTAQSESAFPPNARFNQLPETKKISIAAHTPTIPQLPLPIDDTNLWCWQPSGVPFPVFLHQRVNRTMTQHARQNHEREVGGILLGDVRQNEEQKMYIVVTHTVQAEFANETRGHLTFTQETWLKIHQTRETQYPDKTIVGWYHTHPGWTIFLSSWDLFIHQNFFKQPWQIALVIDPSLNRGGIFVWQDNAIINPQKPIQPFHLAELDGWNSNPRPRVRIRLTDNMR